MTTSRRAPGAATEPRLRHLVRATDRQRIERVLRSTEMFRADEIEIAGELVDERLAQGDASGYHFLFLERAGETLGYSCYGPIPLTLGSWDLYWIAVDPGRHRHGLGRRLLDETEQHAATAGARKLFVDTSGRAEYLPTRAFYEGCGYQVAARLVDFYAPGDDKVVYVRDLG